jgi:hypothetical protein
MTQSGHCGSFCERVGNIDPASALRLQRGLDGPEQLEANRAVVAPQRDHEAHLPVPGGAGVARQRADAVEGAGLVRTAIVAAEQVGVCREKVEHLGEAAGHEAVAAADARALLELDGFPEVVHGEHLARDL